jgi:hybrid cluster-associated redox disulfide protein
MASRMSKKRSLDLDLSVDHLMRTWPEAVGVFVRQRMLCVGCPIGPFHTMADACREHSIDEEAFRQELRLATGERLDG